ncbi:MULTISPECIES: hypothetical protein [Proteus]|uniref:hypothetical protein n=1 Tax=Proteus TaxID=583 RepID=UPI001E5299D7|nr:MULTISPECIES: hypothetical protein [Proteus]
MTFQSFAVLTVIFLTEFFQDGAARKIDFSLTLKRVDDSISQMLGDLSDQLGMMTNGAGEAMKGVLS